MKIDLFDPKIPILKFDDDRNELEKLKKQYFDYDPIYVRTACDEPIREVIEEAYELCKDYLDQNFTKDIKIPGRFLDKLWELHLCVVLLHNNYNLEKNPGSKKARPDFCILLPNNNKIWIEAVCPDIGNDKDNSVEPLPEMVPGIIYSYGGNIEDSVRPRILRVSSVLDKKFKKRTSYIESGLMKENEPYIIAVNTSRINHNSPEEMIEQGVLYGMGLMQINLKNGGASRQFTPYQIKKTDEGSKEIPTALFLRPEYKKISGVMFSRTWFNFDTEYRETLSSKIYTYFNENASNLIFSKDIKFGKKIQLKINGDKGTLVTSDTDDDF